MIITEEQKENAEHKEREHLTATADERMAALGAQPRAISIEYFANPEAGLGPDLQSKKHMFDS